MQAAARVAPETGSDFPFSPFPSYEIGCFRTARSGQGRAKFARRSEPLTARTVLEKSSRRERGSGLPTTNPEYPVFLGMWCRRRRRLRLRRGGGNGADFIQLLSDLSVFCG